MALGRGRTRTRDVEEEEAPRGRTRERGGRDGGKERERRPAGMRGAAGYEVAREEAAKAKARRELNKWGPMRFWLEPGEEEVEVIITDRSLKDVFWMHEHAIWNGKGNDFVPCTKDQPNAEPCVLCAEAEAKARDKNSPFKHSYYALFLSVIDTRSYKNKEGKKVPFSKRLLVIKQSQVDRFWRILQAAEKKYGTIRGVSMLLSRDGEKSARHGEPVMLENGTLFDMIPEKELKADFSTPAIKGKDGAKGREANWELTPYDYDTEFNLPDQAALATAYNLEPTEGSRASMEQEWEGEGGRSRRRRGGDKDDAPPPRRSRGRVEEEPEEEEPEEDDAPRGRRRGRREEPEDDADPEDDDDAGDADADDDEDDADGDEPEEEAPRGRTRGRGRVKEEEEEEPPPRGRTRRGRTEEAEEEDEPRGRSRGRVRSRRGDIEDDEDGIPF